MGEVVYTYLMGVGFLVVAYPIARATLLMQFDTDPEKQARLMEIIHEEVMTIIKDGPLANDLQKEKESMLKDFVEDLEKNYWWMEAIQNYEKFGVNLAAEYETAVNSIMADSIQSMLKKLVDAGNMFEVVMMPE